MSVANVPHDATATPRATVSSPPIASGRATVERRYIVCGGSTLAFRLVKELQGLPDSHVTVVIRAAFAEADAPMESLDDVDTVLTEHFDADVLTRARVADCQAIAFTDQDDIGNLDAALLARELAPDVRIVTRMFDEVLAESVHELVADCAVLSATAVAAPAFVAAAVGRDAAIPLRLFGRSVFVAERDQTRAEDVLCGLAVTTGGGEPRVLPAVSEDADLVLSAAVAGGDPEPPARTNVHRQARRRALLGLLSVVGKRLRLVFAVLLIVIVIGTVTVTELQHVSWWQGFYVAVLSTISGAVPDLSASGSVKVLHIAFTVLSIAVIPLVTAAVVEAVVSARLALAGGGLVGEIDAHIVVVGLGDLGTRVLTALDDAGFAVVGVDRDPNARGIDVARARRIPVIIGDTGRLETLRSASVPTARGLVVLTSSDLVNVQTALLARKLNPAARSVLRVFDSDFAERVQRTFAFMTSRSVSALAAPSFAAEMLDHEVVATIPVRRRVLLAAEIPIGAGSLLENRTVGDLQHGGSARVVAIRTGRGAQVLWVPPSGRKLVRTDVILTVSNREGLGDLLYRAAAPSEPVTASSEPLTASP